MIRHLCRLLLLLAFGLVGSAGMAAPPPGEYQIKAAYLINFARYVEWPSGRLPVGGVLRMFAGGSSFSDALLRPTCKYLELICEFASSQLSTQDRATIFEGVLSAALNRLLESQLEIVAPLLLALLQADPLELGRRLQSRLTASPALQEIGKKMVACRTPRLFARLLLQLVQNLPSNPPC